MTLINDILRLSELDEGGSLPTEPVELLSLCTDTVKSLESAAQQRQITMTVTGEAPSSTIRTAAASPSPWAVTAPTPWSR